MRQRHAGDAVGGWRWCLSRWVAPHAEVTKRRGGLTWRTEVSIGGAGGGDAESTSLTRCGVPAVGHMFPQPRLPWLEVAPHFAEGVAGGMAGGIAEGVADRTADGKTEDTAEGTSEGATGGTAEGTAEGMAGDTAEGTSEGVTGDTAEGTAEGMAEGIAEGTSEGATGVTKGGDKEGEGSREDAAAVGSGATE